MVPGRPRRRGHRSARPARPPGIPYNRPIVRKLLLVLFAVLMPLQWSLAAVVAHCPAQAAARADQHDPHAHEAGPHGHHGLHAARRGQVPDAAVHDRAARHAHHLSQSPDSVDVSHGSTPDAVAGEHGRSHGSAQGLDPACCHAAVSLPPGLMRVPLSLPALLDAPAPAMPPLSHASDGPFRPPSPRFA